MLIAREVAEIVGAEFAGGRWRVAGDQESFGELVGAGGFDEMDVRVGCGGKHRRDRAPAGGNDGEIVSEGFDQCERLGFVRVGGRVTEDIGGGEERVFFGFVGETDVANDVGAEGDDLGEEGVLIGDGGETAGDGELEGVGLAAIGDGDRGEKLEEAFFARTQSQEQKLGGRLVPGFEFWVFGRGEVEAVGDDGGAFGVEVLGVGEEFGGEGDREIGAAQETVSEQAFERGGVMREPIAEPDGVPMEDE